MPRDSLILIRRSLHHDGRKRVEIPWEAIGSVCLTAVLVVALILYFFVDNGPSTQSPGSSEADASSSATSDETTSTSTGGRDLQEADFDSIPAIPAIPDVLLCGTSGEGNHSLPNAISVHCTHAIFTGPIILDQDDYGRLFMYPQDKRAFSTFLEVKDPVKKYVSLPCSLFESEHRSEITIIASKFFSRHSVVGFQLRITSRAQLDIAVTICQDFQRIHPGEFNTVLWLTQSLLPDKAFFENTSTTVEYIVFESQRLQSDGLHSLRFPNPYGPFRDGANDDVFLGQKVSQIVPLQRHLEANSWCFSISLGATKCVKDTLYSKITHISTYYSTTLREVCDQLLVGEARYSEGAMSRYVESEYVFYGYDDLSSLIAKLSKLLFRYPGFCIAVYDVEGDDLEDHCRRVGTDVGAPLLRVLSQLVTARTDWNKLA